ncbi:MAG: hypothetical protein QGH11_07640, partial [Pirellulaceae bacterium]|nr:hypothetical protein [Pirellulaceae bacterium]
MKRTKQLSQSQQTAGANYQHQTWSLVATIAALLCGLLLATGCNQQKTPAPGVKDPASADNPPPLGEGADTGFNDPRGDMNAGSDRVGLDIVLLEVTDDTAVDFTYR